MENRIINKQQGVCKIFQYMVSSVFSSMRIGATEGTGGYWRQVAFS